MSRMGELGTGPAPGSPAAQLGMVSFHGSPHKFRHFDLSKVGTGEGAAAYGHGVYLAENPETAKVYADVLGRMHGGSDLTGKGVLNRMFEDRPFDKQEAIDEITSRRDFVVESNPEDTGFIKKMDEALQLIDEGYTPDLKGNIYEVELPDKDVEEMLDWDMPVEWESGLGQRLATAAEDAGLDVDDLKDILGAPGSGYEGEPEDGRAVYQWLSASLGGDDLSDKKASEFLRDEVGIPGIKYLDQGSRYGEGESRNFVVFDESRLKVLKRNDEKIGPVVEPPPAPTPGKRISTRFPTAKTSKENPLESDLQVSLEISRSEPEKFKTNVQLLGEYTPVRDFDTPEEGAEQYVEMAQRNLEFLFDSVPGEIRERSRHWYVGANRLATEATGRYGTSIESASGVYAALSPQKDWFMNVALGDTLMDIISSKSDAPWSREMASKARSIYTSPAQRSLLAKVEGRSLAELVNPLERAAWIRLFDETYSNRAYNIITPEGTRGEVVTTKYGNPATYMWSSNAMIANAVKAFDHQDFHEISRAMGMQHKVRNFYNNIVDPNAQSGDVTMDTHAVAAALLQPFSGNDIAVAHNLGSTPKKKYGARGPANSDITGMKGTYPFNAEAYRRAAQSRGVLPREMQSITWEAIRGLFNNKSAKVRDAANSVWLKYKNGMMEQEEAQAKILKIAGGINVPAWAE